MSPFLRAGQYQLQVYYNNQPAELINMVVAEDGRAVITGPRWVGDGYITQAGGYVGRAVITEAPSVGLYAQHVFIWNHVSGELEGYATYWQNRVDQLVWRPVSL